MGLGGREIGIGSGIRGALIRDSALHPYFRLGGGEGICVREGRLGGIAGGGRAVRL